MLTAARNRLHRTCYTHHPQRSVGFKAPEDRYSLATSCIKRAPGLSFWAGSLFPLAGAGWERAGLQGHTLPGGLARSTTEPRDAARARTSPMPSLAEAGHPRTAPGGSDGNAPRWLSRNRREGVWMPAWGNSAARRRRD